MSPDPREWSVEDWDKAGWTVLVLFGAYVALSSLVAFAIMGFFGLVTLFWVAENQ